MRVNLAEALAEVAKVGDVTQAKVIVKDGLATLVKFTEPQREIDGVDELEDVVLNTGWGEIDVTLINGRPIGCQVERHLRVEE